MNKTIKKLLTASLAILMLAGVGAGTANTQVNARHRRTHRINRHIWHKGAPRVIQGNAFWLSRQSFKNHSHQIPRYKNVIWFQHDQVEMATNNYYRYGLLKYARKYPGQKRGWLMSNGLGMWWNPHYKYIGHQTYLIHAGGGHGTGRPDTYRVKVHNHNHVTVWWNGHFMGSFHKWHHI